MNYWLLKSEPDGYSIDDLKRDKKSPWTGVRNFAARNNLLSMKRGDLCLYYHTGGEKAIVGVAKVASEPYPDPTQFDAKSPYFEPKSTKEKPLWHLVDVAFEEKLKTPVALERIKREPALSRMTLLKAPRLSVQPVSKEQFSRIVRDLSR